MSEPRIIEADDANIESTSNLLTRFFREEAFELPGEGMTARLDKYRRTPGHGVFVAIAGGRTVTGAATIAVRFSLEYGRYAELEDLYVVPEERGRGTGRALIERATSWAAEQGARSVLVTVTPEGQAAHDLLAFYARLGFVDDGRRIIERRLA